MSPLTKAPVRCSSRSFSASTRGDFATTSLRKFDRLHPGLKKKAFREDCARVWGNLYDYSSAKYQEQGQVQKQL